MKGMDTVTITEAELRRVITDALTANGLPAEDAAIAADALTEAELRGRATHGLVRLRDLVETIPKLSHGRPHVVSGEGPVVQVDGRNYLGYVACRLAVDEAVVRARLHGHALVAARPTRHTGMLGYYVDRLARAGFAALAFSDCVPIVAPWGGAERVLGTNPLAAAFPREPWPILIDMGTSAVTMGDVLLARRAGRPLPEGVAVDADGHMTTDPARVPEGALLPMAEHKGYALALLVQLLAGVLTGAAGVPSERDEYGTFFVVIKPTLFAPGAHVTRELELLVAACKGARPMEGFGEVRLPGERGYRERERRLAEGIPVAAEVWREAKELAGG